MENNRKIFNCHFLLIIYFLMHEDHQNTYIKLILVKLNKNCGNYKQKNYRQYKKIKNNTKIRNLL